MTTAPLRVVTTCTEEALKVYGHRWLESRKNWPADTEFWFYTEGYKLPDETGLTVRDFEEIRDFSEWKAKHRNYRPSGWQWDVVAYSHKIFAAADALKDHTGVGVWLDADCVTFNPVPKELVEKQVEDAYIAHYGRTGLYTETGMWIINCAHERNKDFLEGLRGWYLGEHYKKLPQWHDCFVLDATIKDFVKCELIKANNLSGEHHKQMHPQAMTEFGKYIDHCKGSRKVDGKSPENKRHVLGKSNAAA